MRSHSRLVCRRIVGLMRGREIDYKSGAMTELAFDMDQSAVPLDNFQGEAQTQTHAISDVASGEEGVKDLGLVFGGDPDAVVFQLDLDASSF